MQTPIPSALRNWFIIHCIVDLVFAIPLFLFPEWTLKLFDWPHFDPLATRLVAAALFGIGLESYLGRDGGLEKYLGMLRLKVIWSGTAAAGILITQFSMSEKPVAGWLLASIFIAFNLLWVYWWRRLA